MKKSRVGYWALICFVITLLTACNNKQTDMILPFSNLQPGMTIEAVKRAEPEAEDLSAKLGQDAYMIKKDYYGLEISTVVFFESASEGIYWTVETKDQTKADQAVQNFTAFCNQKYTLEEERSADTIAMKHWKTETYSIRLLDNKEADKRTIGFFITIE